MGEKGERDKEEKNNHIQSIVLYDIPYQTRHSMLGQFTGAAVIRSKFCAVSKGKISHIQMWVFPVDFIHLPKD